MPLLEKMHDAGKFSIPLSPEVRKFIERLDETASYRYFEISYYNERHDLLRLDKAVWEIRRYCQPLDYQIRAPDGFVQALQPNLARLRSLVASESKETGILSGWLEKVITGKSIAARGPLLWNNLFFGPSSRKTVRMVAFTEAGNSPLYMHPEILEEVLKFVYLPKEVIAGWRAEAAARAAVSANPSIERTA